METIYPYAHTLHLLLTLLFFILTGVMMSKYINSDAGFFDTSLQ